jgi:hypothetical protein
MNTNTATTVRIILGNLSTVIKVNKDMADSTKKNLEAISGGEEIPSPTPEELNEYLVKE